MNIVDESRDTDQLQLALAWHTPGRHSPQRHALRLLSLMLGESASSRLFLELREKRGLCYQITSDVSFLHETGAFEIHAGLAPEGRNAALECIHAEINDLATRGPADGELERAKRLAISQNKQALESTASHATWAGECLLEFGHIPHPLEWRDQVLAVTHDEIQSIASQIFSGQTPAMAEIKPDAT
jgi:predicted Zn-dependent peptidase